jgi:hypothetical protein
MRIVRGPASRHTNPCLAAEWVGALVLSVGLGVSTHTQVPDPNAAVLYGTVVAEPGAQPLSGVTVTLTADPRGDPIPVAVTAADGRFTFSALGPGRYHVRLSLAGFSDFSRGGLILAAHQTLTVTLVFPLTASARAQVASQGDDSPTTGASRQVVAGRMIDIAPVRGDDYLDLLPMLPGVLRGPDGRINVNGGRPAATGLQIGPATASDPVTGDAGVDLPVDAVATIEVLPNPYTAEDGRFSAGIVRIETQPGGAVWSATANNFIPAPCLKLCDGASWGIRSYDPRLIVSGPLAPHRLFLAESLQFHDHLDRVPSLPQGQEDTSVVGLESFTRLDATLGHHIVTGSVAASVQHLDFAGLNTFNPQPVTPDIHRGGYNATLSDTLRFSDTAVLETTVSRDRSDASVAGQTSGVMTFTPDGNSGSFFNRQDHQAWTTQWIEALSFVRRAAGDHLIKLGTDVQRASFDGTSDSGPVDVRREDGTLAERLDFPAATSQQLAVTDLSAFVQDRWRANDRLLFELGARVDRDGVTRQVNGSPRFGFVLGVLPDGRGIVRGGIGAFAARTPLLAGAFQSIEAPTVSQFAADGSTLAGPAISFINRLAGPLVASTSRVWNVEYDHRLAPGLVLKLNHLERTGWHDLVVNPVVIGSSGEVDLASDGRSRYEETEATVRYAGTGDREVSVSYVRSQSAGDLNTFDTYFGLVRNPILQPDAYGVTSVDVPNRLIVRAVAPGGKWMVSPLLEVRSGFPYSFLNNDQQFVGPRNSGRFPLFYTLDLNITRTIMFRGRKVRIGLRSNHILNNSTPQDVQANVNSPAFGTFYNSLLRRFGLTFEVRR